MRVETSAGTYFIDWKHQETNIKRKIKIVTTCYIKDDKLTPIENNHAYCSVKDNFNKEKGRKISLARAMQYFDKPVRKEIWEAYLNRKPKAYMEYHQVGHMCNGVDVGSPNNCPICNEIKEVKDEAN